jgi:hypothetical protein
MPSSPNRCAHISDWLLPGFAALHAGQAYKERGGAIRVRQTEDSFRAANRFCRNRFEPAPKRGSEPMSKTFNLSFACAVLGSVVSFNAQALPISALDSRPASEVTLVAGGCGIGFHRGPYGGCRANAGAVVVTPGVVVAPVAPVVVVPGRACPLGMHLGPERRRCIPN